MKDEWNLRCRPFARLPSTHHSSFRLHHFLVAPASSVRRRRTTAWPDPTAVPRLPRGGVPAASSASRCSIRWPWRRFPARRQCRPARRAGAEASHGTRRCGWRTAPTPVPGRTSPRRPSWPRAPVIGPAFPQRQQSDRQSQRRSTGEPPGKARMRTTRRARIESGPRLPDEPKRPAGGLCSSVLLNSTTAAATVASQAHGLAG